MIFDLLFTILTKNLEPCNFFLVYLFYIFLSMVKYNLVLILNACLGSEYVNDIFKDIANNAFW